MKNMTYLIKNNVRELIFSAAVLILPVLKVLTRNLYSTDHVSKIPLVLCLAAVFFFLVACYRSERFRLFFRRGFAPILLLAVILSFSVSWGRGFSVYLDRYSSFLPFFYSAMVASILFIPALVLLMKLTSRNGFNRSVILYILIFALIAAVVLWHKTERGWEPLVLWFGIMFYPSKYTLFSFILMLVFTVFALQLPDDRFGFKQPHSLKIRVLLWAVLIVYTVAASSVPFVLQYYKINILERENQIHTMKFRWGCDEYTEVKDVKACLEKRIGRYKKAYLYRYYDRRFRSKDDTTVVVPQEETEFRSIKDCYSKAKCAYVSSKTDRMENLDVHSEWNGSPHGTLDGSHNNPAVFEQSYRPLFWALFPDGTPDIILARTDGKREAFLVRRFILKMTPEKIFAEVIVTRYRETDKKMKTPYKKYATGFEVIGGYRFYDVLPREEKEIKAVRRNIDYSLSVSLDRRENPSRVFVETKEKTYSFDIN